MKRKLSSKYYDNLERLAKAQTETKRQKLDLSIQQSNDQKQFETVKVENKAQISARDSEVCDSERASAHDQVIYNLSPNLFYSPQINCGLPGMSCEPLFSPIHSKAD